MKYDGILFDFDGVLVDSEPVHHEAWNEVLGEFGLAIGWEVYRGFIGWSDRDMIRHLCEPTGGRVTFEQVWARYPAKQRGYRERMAGGPPCPDGIRRLLEELGAAYRMAVVSSSSRHEVEALLEAAGIRAHFETVVGSEDVRRHKPDPEPYLEAARRLGLDRPLVVEDSDPGAEAGRAAGFEVVRVASCDEVPGKLRALLRGTFIM